MKEKYQKKRTCGDCKRFPLIHVTSYNPNYRFECVNGNNGVGTTYTNAECDASCCRYFQKRGSGI